MSFLRRREVKPARLLTAAGTYFLAHWIAFLFPDSARTLMAFWPVGGIALAALLLNPRRSWPVFLASFFVAGNLANVLEGRAVFASLGFMSANVLESYLCAWTMRTFCGNEVRFQSQRDFLALGVSATLVNACSSLVGAGTAALVVGTNFWSFWLTWFVADGLGILLVTPLLVSFLSPSHGRFKVQPRGLLEWSGFLVVVLGLGHVVFNGETLQPYLLVILLSLLSMRTSLRGLSLILATLTALIINSHSISDGPLLWGGADIAARLLQAQVFIAVVGFASFLLFGIKTDAQAARQSALEAQDRYRSLFQNSPNAIFVFELAENGEPSCFTQANEGACALLGYTERELLGMTLAELVPGQARELMAQWLGGLQASSHFQGETAMLTRFGQAIPVEVSSHLVQIQDRMVNMSIVRNISERKATERELLQHRRHLEILVEERTRELQTALRVKSQFLSNMSHEIRTPMNSILGFAQVLRKQPEFPKSLQHYTDTILSSGNHLLGIIEEVLCMSRLESGQVAVHPEPTNLRHLLAEVDAMCSFKAMEKQLKVEVSVDPDIPDGVLVDQGKFRQVLLNLLGNAIKFTDSGRVLVHLCEVQSPASGSVRRLCIEVIDTGSGIPQTEQQQIFAPFVQAANAVGRGGTGLGLAISSRYAQLMGGSLTVESTEKVGSKFRFEFCVESGPLAPVADVATDASASATHEAKTLSLPERLRLELVDCIENGEVKQFQALLESQVKPNRQALATRLHQLSRAYQYNEILEILDAVRGAGG